jgi:dTDP-4-dehydrorhamnose reductase
VEAIKVMIIGALGMLGHDLQKVFPGAELFDVVGDNLLDITDENMVMETVEAVQPDVVINAAAYTDVDGCEDNAGLSLKVNGEALANIAKACHKMGAKLVHYSTDYIFDGKKQEYVESDIPNPINAYGVSKLLGEKNIQDNMDDYCIIRTSWLFGKNGKNFIETMLALSEKMDTVNVVNDQFGKPTYAADLARKTKELIDLDPGIYHITNEGVCSWYEFASAAIPNTVPCSSEEFIRKAKRPKYSILVNTKTNPMRHWKDALTDYLKEKKT